GNLFEFSGWNGRKYYDQFDYVTWFSNVKKDQLECNLE
ncbi:MAG: exopolysaccharide biosynthesis protein, partial [Haemophilus parahaemolyticus]|nr:exopolysaccharide biosynthesis protein [Haemophilus parahaemolyticus]